MQLASRFGHVNQIRRERPLTREELMYHVPSIFGEDRHTSRSERYAYIPTITAWKICSGKAFSRSSPARPVCATRAAGNIPNICCVCGGPDR